MHVKGEMQCLILKLCPALSKFVCLITQTQHQRNARTKQNLKEWERERERLSGKDKWEVGQTIEWLKNKDWKPPPESIQMLNAERNEMKPRSWTYHTTDIQVIKANNTTNMYQCFIHIFLFQRFYCRHVSWNKNNSSSNSVSSLLALE